ncbi:MAG: YbbR-like domain-containing protein [Anaerovoracaceae bacterium]
MFKSRKLNIIVSVVIAVFLWAYVVGEVNPKTTHRYSDIPIEFVHSGTLIDNDLALVDPGRRTVTVTLSGRRAALYRIDAEDIRAVVDVGDCSKGKNRLDVSIKAPKDLGVSSASPAHVKVQVSDAETMTFKPKAVFANVDKGKEAGSISIEPAYVTLSGSSSQLKKVNRVRARVNAAKFTRGYGTISADPVPVNAAGTEVEYLRASPGAVSVSASIYDVKTVPLSVKVTGSADSSVRVTKKDVPTSMKIRGDADLLADVNEIEAEPIDISGIKKTTEFEVQPVLPADVEAADDSQHLKATIQVEKK